jgi:hypothetical protein
MSTAMDDETRRVKLIAHRYAPAGYERIAPGARGWIWLNPIWLWLAMVHDPLLACDRLACFDAESSEEIGDYQSISQALEIATAERAQAKARTESEATRADAETNVRQRDETWVRELEDSIRRLSQGT